MRKLLLTLAAIAILPTAGHAANLLTNGDFEASGDHLNTPPGWTNIGHTGGVLAYTDTNTPAYDGLYYYDFGAGGSNGNLSAGEGIEQAVGTATGDIYRLTFGYTVENCPGCSTVFTVNLGNVSQDFTVNSTAVDNSGFFQQPFTTTTLSDYVATGGLTNITFTMKSETNPGNNDPMIDKVIFERIGTTNLPSGAPEPATWAIMVSGFGLLGGAMRRRRTALSAA